jgi:hypothetical protein
MEKKEKDRERKREKEREKSERERGFPHILSGYPHILSGNCQVSRRDCQLSDLISQTVNCQTFPLHKLSTVRLAFADTVNRQTCLRRDCQVDFCQSSIVISRVPIDNVRVIIEVKDSHILAGKHRDWQDCLHISPFP